MMKNVIIAWVTQNEVSFEQHVPLLFIGQRNQNLGFTTPFHVLFLQGFNHLSDSYKAALRACGYELHDVSSLFDHLEKSYAQLRRFGEYEKKCFLRWLVMQQFFNGEPLIHYDGDVVLNENPETIKKKVQGKTFILQGCPAFTVISDRAWFDCYKSELDEFVHNIQDYSARAWRARQGWEVTFQTRWSGSRFREIITSDQDFLSHLMHTGGLPHSPSEEVRLVLDDYVVFQNPLLFHLYNQHIPYSYERSSGVDYFSFTRADGPNLVYRKKVLLWHMQSCFTFYASKYIMRKKYLITIKPFCRIEYNPSGTLFEDYVNKRVARFTYHTLRSNVYNYFFKKHDFSGLMSNKMWWKKGLFK